MEDQEVHESLAQAEAALAELDTLPPPTTRAAIEAIEATVRVYGEALRRIVGVVASEAPHLGARLTGDDLVSHLLLLHGLHPDSLQERVEHAVSELRPIVEGRGGSIELVGVEGTTARVRVDGSGGCGSGGLDATVEEALLGRAPELEHVEVERPPVETVIPVEALVRRPAGKVSGA